MVVNKRFVFHCWYLAPVEEVVVVFSEHCWQNRGDQ